MITRKRILLPNLLLVNNLFNKNLSTRLNLLYLYTVYAKCIVTYKSNLSGKFLMSTFEYLKLMFQYIAHYFINWYFRCILLHFQFIIIIACYTVFSKKKIYFDIFKLMKPFFFLYINFFLNFSYKDIFNFSTLFPFHLKQLILEFLIYICILFY